MTTTKTTRARKTIATTNNDAIDASNVDVTNANDTNATIITNDETNASNVDVTTRATTRALTNASLNIDENANVQTIKIDDAQIKIVRTSSNALRVDHSMCTHATTGNDGKRARAKCRAKIANAK